MRALFALCLFLTAAACGAPSSAEGNAQGRPFSVADAEPEVRVDTRGRTTIVLAQEQPGTPATPVTEESPDELWLVVLTLPEGFTPEIGVPVLIGPEGSGLPTLEIAVGELLVETTSGKRVATTQGTEFHPAVSGELVFWSVEKILAADFTAALKGGGEVKGAFEVLVD